MTYCAIIPARGGSVGLPGKNTADLGGLPLIQWTTRAALVAGVFDRIIVSTDSPDIASVAKTAGVEVLMRPELLARSETPTSDVVVHVLQQAPSSAFALLQPTSPFRRASHVIDASEIFFSGSYPSIMAVTHTKPASWIYLRRPDGALEPVATGPVASRRQDAPDTVTPNGGIYITGAEQFLKERNFAPEGSYGFLMGRIDSIDIDEPEDLELARAIVATGVRRADPLPMRS